MTSAIRTHTSPTGRPLRRSAAALGAAAVTLLTGLALGPAALAGEGGGAPVAKEFVVEQVLNPNKCANAAEKAGWNEYDLVIATAVALAESGCNPDAVGSNPPTEGCPNGSRDRGVWQINDCYHSEVSDKCAFDLQCNADAAYDIWAAAGGSFQPWSAYNSRAFKIYLSEARKAVRHVTGENYPVGIVETDGSGPLTVRAKPNTHSEAVGSLPDQAVIEIKCQTRGERVYSPIFDYDTKIWDSLGDRQYVSDGYVYTDSSKLVADRC